MRHTNWNWQSTLFVIVVIVIVVLRVWAEWTVCKGDIACIIVGAKYVVTPDQR